MVWAYGHRSLDFYTFSLFVSISFLSVYHTLSFVTVCCIISVSLSVKLSLDSYHVNVQLKLITAGMECIIFPFCIVHIISLLSTWVSDSFLRSVKARWFWCVCLWGLISHMSGSFNQNSHCFNNSNPIITCVEFRPWEKLINLKLNTPYWTMSRA